MISNTHRYSKRKKLSEEDCREIYQMTESNGKDAGLSLCKLKGYKVATFYKCLELQGEIHPNWIHPPHSKKWSDDQIDQALHLISENPILTLTEIIDKMTNDFNAPQISLTTLSQYLLFNLITLKKVSYQPAARYSNETKEQRKSYCEYFVQNEGKNYIYIDEVGYSIAVQRNRGRSRKGNQCIQKLPLAKTPNTTICMAISQNEILHFEKKNAAFDSISFGNFLKQLIDIIEERQIDNPCLILDNSPVHREIDIRKICQGRIEFHFLLVYSPNLNPIENVFAIIIEL